MATGLFDIETDGLNPTKVHCVVVRKAEHDSGRDSFRPHQIRDAVAYLEEFDTIVAHNGVTYDVPVMKRLAGLKTKRVRDSLVLSRQLFGHIKEAVDFNLIARTKAHKAKRAEMQADHEARVRSAMEEAADEGLTGDAIDDRLPPPLPPDDFIGFPGNMAGRHGIEAWGFRFGLYKGDYQKMMLAQGKDPWAEFNEDMLNYCQGDVDILHKLWMDLIRPRLLGHIAPFNIDVDIHESFIRLGKREANLRSLRIPIEIPPASYTKDKPFNVGVILAEKVREHATSLPASSMPKIEKIAFKDFPGYCTPDIMRPMDDVTRTTISMEAPRYIDRDERIANEKRAANERDASLAAMLSIQSKNRQIILTRKIAGIAKAKLSEDQVAEHMLQAISSAKLFAHGPTSGMAVDIEHYMAQAMDDLERSGIKIDRPALDTLIRDLEANKAELVKKIEDQFPKRVEPRKWEFREFEYGPTNPTAREKSRFPLGRLLFPQNRAHAPQRNLPHGYVREFWGKIEPSPEHRKAVNKAKRDQVPFVDNRPFIEADKDNNIPRIYEGDRTPIKWAKVNPGSRPQIVRRLLDLGWTPDTFSATGTPVLDDTCLKKAAIDPVRPIPVAEDVRMYLLVQKRLGQIANGKQAWKRLVDGDDMLHPHINPCGAVTARATHSNPNVSQVPTVVRVKDPTPTDPGRTRLAFGKEGEWGADCRRLFTVPNKYKINFDTHPQLFVPDKKGELHVSIDALLAHDPTFFVVVGADLAGIELRMLAHYLLPYDGGKFLNTLLNEDVHEANRVILQFANREDAKRFLFALLYGAGDEKLGSIYNPTGTKAEKIAAGKMFRARLMAGIEGFQDLVNSLRRYAYEGSMPGLDGRFIPIRSPHAALNTLLQSGGALVSKYWIKEVRERVKKDLGLEYGYQHDNAYTMLLWSHDEIQNAVRAKHAVALRDLITDAAASTQKILELNVPIKADGKIGLNWLETH